MQLLPILAALLACSTTVPNDGWVGYGGAPKLMDKPHPSIRMVSENIHIIVYKEKMRVTADFEFKNEGAATMVRIGFPDYDSHGEEAGQRSFFSWFRSRVDGERVSTKLIAGSQGEAWRVKSVAFGKGQTRHIRNEYESVLGSQSLGGDAPAYPAVHCLSYIVHTGASWKGSIGRTEITIRFAEDAPVAKGTLKAVVPSERQMYDAGYWRSRPDALWVKGPAKPTLRGRTLRFVRTNYRPIEDDDVFIQFGYHHR